jgi:hypothetical protein
MAKHDYIIASDEGAERYGAEAGEKVELDLTVDEKRALIAAGWLEEVPEQKPKEARK